MKKPQAKVTDHAVLRWLERVHGLDIQAVRDDLGRKVDKAITAGAGSVVVDGIRMILDRDVLITAVKPDGRDIRTGRVRRRREIETDD